MDKMITLLRKLGLSTILPTDANIASASSPLSQNSTQSIEHFEFIDALRAIAAFSVLLFHLVGIPRTIVIVPEWARCIVLNDGIGVTLFFLVSAFCLCLTMGSHKQEGRIATGFYLRRVFRIVPLFYLWLAIMVYWESSAGLSHSWQDLLLNVFFGFNFFPGKHSGIVWASWTLGVEMVFYLLFPIIYRYVYNCRRALVFFIFTLVLAAGYDGLVSVLPVPDAQRETFTLFGFFHQFPIFAIGMLVFFVYKRFIYGKLVPRSRGYILIGIAIAGYLGLRMGSENFLFNSIYIRGLVCAVFFLGLAIAPLRAIVNRPSRFIGQISYSFYLNQPTLVFVLIPCYQIIYGLHLSTMLKYVTCLLLTLAPLTVLSYLSYRLIEMPGIRLGRWLITKQAWVTIKVKNIFADCRDTERWSGIIKKFIPPLLLTGLIFLVFHKSLSYFFAQDDFVWLRIAASVKKATQLFGFFLQYNGAGNYRPLTQEVFFFLNYKLFGLNPVPFHVVTLCVHTVNSLLVYGILRQMKQRRMACLAGAIFYGLNSSVFIPVYWISAISELGMALFYLSSVLLFLRYIQEGSRIDYCLSFAACVFALMSKEPAITIPAILLLTYLYLHNTFTMADFVRGIRMVLPFAAVVAVYLGIRFTTVGIAGSGPYKPALNTMILANLWDFFKWSLNDLDHTLSLLAQITQYRFLPAIHIAFMLLLACAGLFLFVKEKRILLFSILWFVIALLPVLPYVHHAQNYYVNISVVGISVLVALIVSKYGGRAKILVGVLMALYILSSVANVHHQEDYSWVAVRSRLAETGIKEMKSLFPTLPHDAVLYLLNTDENDYWAYNFGDLFRDYYYSNMIRVFFEEKKKLPPFFENKPHLFIVFKMGGHLYDVTKQFRQVKGWLSNLIDFSKDSWENQLLRGWYNIEPGGYRWMAKTSETLLRNQKANKKEHLHLLMKGSAVLDYYPSGKVQMILRINGTVIAKKLIKRTGDYSIEADFVGNFPQTVRLAIELNKSFVPKHVTNSSDTRELGITVSRIELW